MENAKYILQNNASWTANCDSKTSYVLTINGVILTIILTSENSNFIYKTLQYGVADNMCQLQSVLRFFEYAALLTFLGCLLTSFYFAYMTLKARVNPADYSSNPQQNDSYVFWGTIAKKDFTSYKDGLYAMNDDAFKEDVVNQVYITSRICRLKFERYNESLRFTATAYIALLVYVIIRVKFIV